MDKQWSRQVITSLSFALSFSSRQPAWCGLYYARRCLSRAPGFLSSPYFLLSPYSTLRCLDLVLLLFVYLVTAPRIHSSFLSGFCRKRGLP